MSERLFERLKSRSSGLRYFFGVLILALQMGTLHLSDVFAAPAPNYAIRLTATYHLQLTVTGVAVDDLLPGECRISGTVTTVFRAPAGTVTEGDEIEVLSECDVAGPEGDTGALADADELSAARYIEMYLNPGADSAFELAGEQYMVINGPTPEPLCETDKAGVTC